MLKKVKMTNDERGKDDDDLMSILIDSCQIRGFMEIAIRQLGGIPRGDQLVCNEPFARALFVRSLGFQVAAGLRKVLAISRRFMYESPVAADGNALGHLENQYYPFVGRGLRVGIGESLDDYPDVGICLDEEMRNAYAELASHPFAAWVPAMEKCFLAPMPRVAPTSDTEWAMMRFEISTMLSILLRKIRTIESVASCELQGAWGRNAYYACWAPRVELPWLDAL